MVMRGKLDPHVVIVEDDPGLRSSLAFQLEAEHLVVRAFASAEAFLAQWDRTDGGCAIIDVNLPGMSGLMLLERLARLGSRFVPIVMTGQGDVSTAVRAMRAGAVDFIEKPFAPGILRKSVFNALEMAERRLPLQRETEAALAKFATLSEREREVFSGLVDGKQGKQIAIDLGISPRTVEIHKARIMTKLGATSLSELLRLGILLEMSRQLGPPQSRGNSETARSQQNGVR
jgi:two-component system, LuxR family, response regulator FixJ